VPRPASGPRRVELVVNGRAVAMWDAPADDAVHELHFEVRVERSCWIALRQFPELHTNPVDFLVAGRPTRASRRGAHWRIATIEQLWSERAGQIAPAERDEARRAFDRASAIDRAIASEAPAGS
jgi:hypothetical protein